MIIRAKTKRRLVILVVSVLVLAALGAGGYFARMQQLRSRAIRARAEGIAAAQAKDYWQALHKVGTYLSRFPKDPEALFYYAQARQNVEERGGQHIVQAIGLYRRLLDLKPDHAEARYALLDLYVKAGFSTETESTADAILANAPNDVRALRAKATALARLRRFDKALIVAQRCNEVVPLDLEGQVLTLSILAKTDQSAGKVVERADKLRSQHAADVRFDLLQSFAYTIAEDSKQAADWARKAAKADFPDVPFVTLLVDQLNSLELFEESLAVMERAAKDARMADLGRAVIARLAQANRWQDVLDRTASLDPKDPSSDVQLLAYCSMGLIQLNRRPEASPIIDALAERKSNLAAPAWAAVLKAVYGQEKSDPKQIIQACEDALTLSPSNAYFHNYLADAYARIGETDMAIQHWRTAVTFAPAWVAPLLQMSRTWTATGKFQEGIAAAQAARQRAPKDPATLVSVVMAWAPGIGGASSENLSRMLEAVEEVQKLSPGEEQTPPLKIAILAKLGKPDAAKAALQAIIDQPTPPTERLLLRLAAISQQAKLGLEKACFDRSQKAHGLTADFALAQALCLHNAGRAQDGLQSLKAAKEGAHIGDATAWKIAWARYLDLSQDAAAKDALIALGEELPDNVEVQWLALGSRSTQSDRTFIGRTIERLRAQAGERGMSWRLAKARWLLQGQPTERETAEATVMLNEVTRSAPDQLEPRLLLAACLERTSNISGAVEQLVAAANIKPDSNAIALDLARLLQAQGDSTRAREYLDRVIQNKATTNAEKRRVAALLVQLGDSDRALTLLQAQDAQGKQEPDLVLAVLYRQRNQLDKAEAMTRKLLEKPTAAVIQFAAELYASQGKLQEADAALAQLDKVEAAPGIKEMIRGAHYERLGNAEQAMSQFNAATRSAPQNPTTWRQLIVYYLSHDKAADALAAADAAAKALPGNPTFENVKRRADLITATAKDPAARPLLISLLGPETESTPASEALQAFARAKAANEPLAQTVVKFRQLADRHPKFLPLQNLTAAAYLSLGKLDDVLTVSSRAMQTAPNAAEPAQLATNALMGLGRWAEVLTTAQQWRERTLNKPLQADIAIATAYLGQGNPTKAIQQLQPYLEPAKSQPDAYAAVITRYAQAQILARQYDAAAAVLKPLLEKSAPWRATWIQLAAAQIRDAQVAAKWLEQVAPLINEAAIDEQVALAQAWQQLSQRSNDPERLKVARAVLEQTAKRADAAASISPEALLALGMTHEGMGNIDAAESAYRRALKAKPDIAIAQNNLAMILLNRGGDLKEAQDLATKAAQSKHPYAANFYDTLAWIQVKAKDYDGADASMKSAQKLEPQNIDWKINLARIHMEAGQKAKALAELDQIEALQPDPAKLNPQARQRLEALKGLRSGSEASVK